VTILVATAVAAGGTWGFTRLWYYVINLDEFQLVPGEQKLLDFSGKPLDEKPWLNYENFRSYLLNDTGDPTGVLRERTSLFARHLTDRVHDALRQCPWVRLENRESAAVKVQRHFPNELEIRIELRSPAFRVADTQYEYLLDEEGVVLNPRLYRPSEPARRRPLIRFTFYTGTPEQGKRWIDEGVIGAMHLIRVLEDNRVLAAVRVEEIRVIAAPEGSTEYTRNLTLIPAAGGEILWGSPAYPGRIPSPSEAPPGRKLQSLIRMIEQYKSVLPQYTIDVRFERPTARLREP